MSTMTNFPTVSDRGVVTHVLVPVEAFERLTGERVLGVSPPSDAEIDAAIAASNDPAARWHDAEDVLRQIVREGVEKARSECRLTQMELGERVGLSQPQMSRLERNPENASLGILRRIAAALAGASSQPER